MLLAQPVKFERQLGGSFGGRAEWIQWYRQMTIAANGIDKLSHGGDIAKKIGIDTSRWSFTRRPRWSFAGRLRGWCRSTQALGKSEELAPRLVDRRRIAPVGVIGL